jgi:hypothetical protein
MYKHGEPSEEFPMVDLSLKEEYAFLDTSRDEEITQKNFGDLNRGLLGLHGDDNVIILNDSNEEEEVREDNHVDAKAAPSSAKNSLAPTASIANDDDTSNEVQDDSNDSGTPNWLQGDSSDDGDEVGMS